MPGPESDMWETNFGLELFGVNCSTLQADGTGSRTLYSLVISVSPVFIYIIKFVFSNKRNK